MKEAGERGEETRKGGAPQVSKLSNGVLLFSCVLEFSCANLVAY